MVEVSQAGGDDVWRVAKPPSTRTCDRLRRVARSEPFGVGAGECVVDGELEGGRCGASFVKGPRVNFAIFVISFAVCGG